MIKKTSYSGILLESLAFAVIISVLFTACSKDDPTLDELLSLETTPVTFEPPSGNYDIFDFAGPYYVGAHYVQIDRQHPNVEIELRQGKHQLFWLSGLGIFVDRSKKNSESPTTFDSDNKTVNIQGTSALRFIDVAFAETSIDVSQYLLPVKKVDPSSITARIIIEVTDAPEELNTSFNSLLLGVIKGIPYVSSVSLLENDFTISDTAYPLDLHDCYSDDYLASLSPTEVAVIAYYDRKKMNTFVFNSQYILCPRDGLKDVHLKAELTDSDGQPLSTTPLPPVTLRRGRTTVLKGPLFSGRTEDWTQSFTSHETYSQFHSAY